MPGLEKGDYNDLPSVKYFLAGKSKKKAGIMLAPLTVSLNAQKYTLGGGVVMG